MSIINLIGKSKQKSCSNFLFNLTTLDRWSRVLVGLTCFSRSAEIFNGYTLDVGKKLYIPSETLTGSLEYIL